MAKESQSAAEPKVRDPIAEIAPHTIDIKTIAQLAADASSVKGGAIAVPAELAGLPGEVPVAVINGKQPEVRSVQRLIEEYRLHPARKKGQAEAQTLEAFIALSSRHKTDDSVIFADMDWHKPSLTAVVDYHQAASGGRAAFGQHRIHYAFPLSDEWKKWIEMNGQPMKQAEFAYFLEDRVPDLSAPTDHERVTLENQFNTKIAAPSQLVELSRGLQVNVEKRIKGVHTLQSGEASIQFEEVHNDAAGQPLKVPGLFILNVAPFFMGEKVRVPVRLRYRPGNPVVWFYEIYRPDIAITEHVRAAMLEAKAATELPAYEGTPEMSL